MPCHVFIQIQIQIQIQINKVEHDFDL
jgi:hypothetical protein